MIHRFQRAAALPLLCLLLAGCNGLNVLEPRPDSTSFYTLRLNDAITRPGASSEIGVAIGPASVAGYLDRSAIAFSGTGSRILYRPLDRWAEPLDESIERFMTQALSHFLGTEKVGGMRSLGATSCDYRFGYTINRLDGAPEEPVQLDVSWWVEDCEGNGLHYANDSISGSAMTDLQNISAYVEQLESVLEEWAGIVAQTLLKIEGSSSGGSLSGN